MRAAIQLYTVRDLLKADFRGTLAGLAEMGYGAVEFAWVYGGLAPAELAALLKDLGLACCGMHVSLDQLTDPAGECYGYADALASEFVTTSLAGSVGKDWDAAIAGAAKAGATAAARGRTFSYHHHAQEFARIGGRYALDLLLERTDPALVKVQLDTHWILKGGEDPVRYIRRYAGRCPQLHIKDMDRSDGMTAEVGTGILDVSGVLAAARDSGVRWVIVEQDHTKRTPLESAAMSLAFLKGSGLHS